MKIQNDMWHQLSVSAVEQKLHTNASCGLSRKEARSRYRKKGANTVFDSDKKLTIKNAASFLTDPALLLFLFVCLLCLLFFEVSSAITSIVCFTVSVILIIRMLLLERRLQEEIEKYRIPIVTVLRDGNEMIISARALVEGDLILLKKGDIVPADCKLVSTERLKVVTMCKEADGAVRFQYDSKNANEASILTKKDSLFELESILFCGSEIIEGEARAIVIAVGDETLISSERIVEIPAEHGRIKHTRSTERILRPYIRIYSFAVFALTILLSVSCFFAGDGTAFLKGFLSVSAFAVIGSQAFLLFCFRMPSLAIRSSFFAANTRVARIIFKSARSVRSLASVTDLFVLGRGATSDGLLHLARCALGDGVLSLEDGETHESLAPLCEALLLEQQAQTVQIAKNASKATDHLKTVRRELCHLSGFDSEGLRLRLLSVTASYQSGTQILDVVTKSGEYTLLFSNHASLLDQCSFYEKNRRTSVLSAQSKTMLTEFMLENEVRGIVNRLIVKRVGTQMILLGILGLHEEILETVSSDLTEMKKYGLKTTFFLSGDFREQMRYLKMLGLETPLIDAREMGVEALASRISTETAFFGVSAATLSAAIRLLSKQKRRVAVIGLSSDDCIPMKASALSIGCDTFFLDDTSSPQTEREERILAGCAANVRRHADVMISRPQKRGGGLTALLQGIRECRAVQRRILTLLSFLLTAHLTRISLVVLTVLFRLGSLPSYELLYSGLLFEIFAALAISRLPVKQKYLSVSVKISSLHVESILCDYRRWLPFVITSFFSVLLTAVMKWNGLLSFDAVTAVLFCSMFLLELIALMRTALQGLTPDAAMQILKLSVLLLIPIVILVILSVLLPAIHSWTRLGQWSLFAVLSLLLTPLLYLLFDRLTSSFFSRTAKK